jgi:hypothetical protein
LAGLDVTIPISATSAALCFVLAVKAYHSNRYADKDYLLNFSAGFLLLGLSFLVLVPLALGLNFPRQFEDTDDIVNFPVFAVMQTMGYALIAFGYYQSCPARMVLLGLVGSLILIVFPVLLPNSIEVSSVDIILYLVNISLLGFILYHMLNVMPPTDLVFTRFLLLTIHEYAALSSVPSTNQFTAILMMGHFLLETFFASMRSICFSCLSYRQGVGSQLLKY